MYLQDKLECAALYVYSQLARSQISANHVHPSTFPFLISAISVRSWVIIDHRGISGPSWGRLFRESFSNTNSSLCFSNADVDECSTAVHGCSQICNNTLGSYTCSCKEGYSLNNDGVTCFPSCSGNITEPTGSFHTPDWPHSYPSLDFRCEWMIDIKNMTNTVIEIMFNEPYGIRGRSPCPTDYVEVLDGIRLNSSSLGKHCFSNVPDPILTSSSQATIIFQGSSFSHSSSRVGVSMSYTTIPIGRKSNFILELS